RGLRPRPPRQRHPFALRLRLVRERGRLRPPLRAPRAAAYRGGGARLAAQPALRLRAPLAARGRAQPPARGDLGAAGGARLARRADHRRRRLQRLAPPRLGDPRAAARHERSLALALRQGGAHLPERAAVPAPRSHLRARLQGRRLAGAQRQALVAALRPSRRERRAEARLTRCSTSAATASRCCATVSSTFRRWWPRSTPRSARCSSKATSTPTTRPAAW